MLREELKARTPVQAGNLLSALRHMIGWMIDEEHIEPDDDPTIGLKSGKAKASRESGGWVPWTEEDMAKYRASVEDADKDDTSAPIIASNSRVISSIR